MGGGGAMENARHRILLVEDDKVDQSAFERLVQTEELPYDYVIAGSLARPAASWALTSLML